MYEKIDLLCHLPLPLPYIHAYDVPFTSGFVHAFSYLLDFPFHVLAFPF